MDIGTLRDPNRSSNTQDKLNRPQMFLKVVRQHGVPTGGSLVTLPTSIFHTGSLQVDMFEGSSWVCQCGNAEESLGQIC